MAALLTVEGIRVSRPGPAGPLDLLREVAFVARAGALTLVVGPSGGGKSTLIRLLNRLDDPDGGRILLDGVDIATLDPLSLRRRVALMGQKPVIFAGSVLDNLQLPFRFQQRPLPTDNDPELLELLELCRLDRTLLARAAASLSLGQQQRVCLARALIGGPEVLLLDEPTSALDRPTADRLAETLRRIAVSRGLVVVMVTHDLRLTERIADEVVFLAAGEVLESGPPGRLFAAPATAALREFLTESPPRQEGES